jgi:beta-lactamase class D
MKKVILLLAMFMLFSIAANASSSCFIAAEGDKVIESLGDCETSYAPNCSFNFALSLMGYDAGFLLDETNPELPYKENFFNYLEKWRQPHNPTLWIKNSCVWYSVEIYHALGNDKFQEYVKKFAFGNQDGRKDGVNKAPWMSGGSIRVSGKEYISFMQKLVERKLPVSSHAYDMTAKIFALPELAPKGWQLYGKTGTGSVLNSDGTLSQTNSGGWFVGWLEQGSRKIVFASYIEQAKGESPSGAIAKEIALERLKQIIQEGS